MSRRLEFSKETKRAAIVRSKGRCEASGAAYGFPRGHRCNADLHYGVEFDHYPIRAADGGGNDLDNCRAVCIRCHRWKTHKLDLPQLAKARRLWDKQWNIRGTPGLPGGKRSGLKKRLNGVVVDR